MSNNYPKILLLWLLKHELALPKKYTYNCKTFIELKEAYLWIPVYIMNNPLPSSIKSLSFFHIWCNLKKKLITHLIMSIDLPNVQ